MAHIRKQVRDAVVVALESVLSIPVRANTALAPREVPYCHVVIASERIVERALNRRKERREIAVDVILHSDHYAQVSDELDALSVLIEDRLSQSNPLGIAGVAVFYLGMSLRVEAGNTGDAADLVLNFTASVFTTDAQSVA